MTADNTNQQKLSVIIPIFNEPRICRNLKIIERELDKSFPNYEIICVDDGSRDKTLAHLNGAKTNKVKVLSYPHNVGKGFALSYGFCHSDGDLVAFIDSDLELHPKQIRIFSDLLDLSGADIVIGSKRHPLSKVKYPWNRRFYSWNYQLMVHLLFGLNVTDTQVGIKLFKRKVLEKVLPKLVVKKWAFDLELLIVACKFGFTKIIEAPIKLNGRFSGSKIDLWAVKNIFQDTLAIFYRNYILKYYDRGKSDSTNIQPLPNIEPKLA